MQIFDAILGMRTCTEARLEGTHHLQRPARSHLRHRSARNLRRLPRNRTEVKMRARSLTASKTSSWDLAYLCSPTTFSASLSCLRSQSESLTTRFPTASHRRTTNANCDRVPSIPFRSSNSVKYVACLGRVGQVKLARCVILEAKRERRYGQERTKTESEGCKLLKGIGTGQT